MVMVCGGYEVGVVFCLTRALNFARSGAELLERGLIPWMVGYSLNLL